MRFFFITFILFIYVIKKFRKISEGGGDSMKFTRIYCVAVFLILPFFFLSADTVNITVSGGSIYVGTQVNFNITGLDTSTATGMEWDFNDGTPKQSGASTSHSFKEPGNYTVKFKWSESGTPKETTKSVNVGDNRKVNTMPNNPGLYTEITFNAQNFMGGNLDWDFGDNTHTNGSTSMKHRYTRMGRFIVKVKQAGSNNEPIEKKININRDMRRIEVNPSSLMVGQRATLRLQNSDVNQVGWKIGNQPVKQNSPPTLQHQFLDPGRYDIQCIIQNQTLLRASVMVRENRQIKVTPQHIFEGAKVIFDTRNFNSPRLKWDFGDGIVQQAGKQHNHLFRGPGNFTVKVFDFNGDARVPVEKRVRVLREDRSIQVKNQTVFKGFEIEIEAKNFRDNTVEWNFGDGGTRRGQRVIKHTFRSTGNFQVAAVDFAGRGSKKIIRNLQVQADTRKLAVPLEVIAGEAYDLALQNVAGGNFEWQFSDGTRQAGISSRGKKFASPGTHQIKLIDRSGKYPPMLKKIVVKPDNRSLQVIPKLALPNESMKVKAVNFRGNTVKWDFGDGTVMTGQKIMNHKYKKIGKYKVQAVDFGGKSQKPFAQDISVVELTPDFDITTVELTFTDGKYYKVVPKKSMAPRYRLKLKVRGRGVIRGKWLMDGMSMGTFSVFALENQSITLQGNKVVKLPMQDLGIHNFTFSFGNYDFKKSLPAIRYFIALGGAINIRAPLIGAKIAATESVKLRWHLRKKGARYELAISAMPFQFLHDAQIKWQSVGDQNEFLLDLKRYKPGTWLYWQVRQVDSSGRVLTTSEIASFRIVAAQ